MKDNTVLVWSAADARANDLIRELMQKARYPWVWRKLNNARWHLLQTHTVEQEYHGQQFVTWEDAT